MRFWKTVPGDMTQDMTASPFGSIPLPRSVGIAITGRCNLRCQYCFYADEMVALDDLEVEVEVPERFYDLLEPGAEVSVDFEALRGFSVVGHVDRIVPRADPQARSFPVKVRILDHNGELLDTLANC